MTKRWILFFALLSLAGPGCGGSGGGGGHVDETFKGQWVAEKPSQDGYTTLLVFEPTKEKSGMKIRSIQPSGGVVDVDQGTYAVDGDKVSFSLQQLGELTSPFQMESGEGFSKLTLGEDIYFKIADGGRALTGQLRLTGISADEFVTVSSSFAPSHAPGEILVREDGGSTTQALSFGRRETVWRAQKVALPTRGEGAALQLRGGLPERVSSLQERRREIREAERQALDQCRREGKKCTLNVKLRTQSVVGSGVILTDPLLEDQWNLRLLNMNSVFSDESFGRYGTAQPVYVAVIDTGVRYDHPDLEESIARDASGNVIGYDFVRDSDGVDPVTGGEIDFDLDGSESFNRGPDPNPWDPGDLRQDIAPEGSDSSWHGTHIAGIIAALRNNGVGIAGMTPPSVKIIPIRAMGLNGNGYISDVAEAIKWACKLPNSAEPTEADIDPDRPKADVINMSVGLAMTYDEAAPMLDAIHRCFGDSSTPAAERVLTVAAAGNDHLGPGYCLDRDTGNFVPDPDCKFYPASDPLVLSIGAVTGGGAFAQAYSNFGENFRELYLVAPGGSESQGVLSTVRPGVGQNGYAELVGTSQSAAHVSALVALIHAYRPTLSISSLIRYLRDTAIYLGETPPWDGRFGYGLVNPRGALLTALGKTLLDPPVLQTSANGLHFGTFGEKGTLILYNAGGGSLALHDARAETTDGGEWLTVEWKEINKPSAPVVLVVTVNREGLGEGEFSGKIVVETNGGTKEVEIAMEVSSLSLSESNEIDALIRRATNLLQGGGGYQNTDDIGEIVIFAKALEGEKTYHVFTSFEANYNFFMNLPTGRYQLFACSDSNGDGDFCGEGDDVRIGYPTLAQPQTIDCTESCTPASLIFYK